MKILHLDDNATWQNLVRVILENHAVISCANLFEAEKIYKAQGPFDLVICDNNLGDFAYEQGIGFVWAQSLHNEKQRVITLAGITDGLAGIPHVEKGFGEDFTKKLHDEVKNGTS